MIVFDANLLRAIAFAWRRGSGNWTRGSASLRKGMLPPVQSIAFTSEFDRLKRLGAESIPSLLLLARWGVIVRQGTHQYAEK